MASVGEAIQDEIKRNYELLAIYKSLPDGAGMIGASFIQADLDFAHQALKDDNVVNILQAYEKLKGNE